MIVSNNIFLCLITHNKTNNMRSVKCLIQNHGIQKTCNKSF